MNSGTDRYSLFDNLNALRGESPGLNYQGIDLLDAGLSPLYLSLLRLHNNRDHGNTGNSLLGKINALRGRITEKIARVGDAKKAGGLISKSRQYYRQAQYLFFPVEPTHLHQMIPVLRIMEQSKEDFLVVTNRVLIYERLKAKGFKPVLIAYPQKAAGQSVDELLTPAVIATFRQAIERNLGRDLSGEFFKAAKDIFEHFAIPFIIQLRELLAVIKPSSVIVGYDITLEGRILTLLCRQMDIRSACIQHGSISGEPLDHHHIIDQFLLYGDAAKDYLVHRGFPAASCVVTGAPYLDGVAVKNRSAGNELKRLLNINPSLPYILVALSGPGHSTSIEHFNKVVRKLLESTIRFPDFQFVAKLHRKDKLENYQPLIDAVPGHRLQIVGNQTFSFEIFDWLDSCDLLITGASTVAQEAMLSGVPVMTIDLMNEYRDVDFIEQGCTIHITDEDVIGQAIENAITNKQAYRHIMQQAQKYSEYFFYKLDGGAARRCASSITEHVRHPEKERQTK